MDCKLEVRQIKTKDNKVYDNLFITTEKGTCFQVALKFFNSKLLYKIKKEIEGK